jgi:hypothetical protein
MSIVAAMALLAECKRQAKAAAISNFLDQKYVGTSSQQIEMALSRTSRLSRDMPKGWFAMYVG